MQAHSGEKIVRNFGYIDALKRLKRTGWLRVGLDAAGVESVAEHSFGAALLGFAVACEFYPHLDAQKVLLLGLIHDLGEAVTGDFLPWEKAAIADFEERERLGACQAVAGLKAEAPLMALYDEFYLGETPEARLVQQVDKLEMLLQAHVYEEVHGRNLGEFFTGLTEGFFDDKLQEVVEFVLQLRHER